MTSLPAAVDWCTVSSTASASGSWWPWLAGFAPGIIVVGVVAALLVRVRRRTGVARDVVHRVRVDGTGADEGPQGSARR